MKTTTLYNIASNKQSNGASASWVVKFILKTVYQKHKEQCLKNIIKE